MKCYRAADYDGAIYHFSEALRFGPPDRAQVLGNRAAAFEKIRDFEAAADDAREALNCNADYLKGYFRLATSLIELKRFGEAEAAAEDGLVKQPTNTQLRELRDKAKLEGRLAHARAAANGAEDDDDDDDDDDPGSRNLDQLDLGEENNDDFGKMVYRLMVVAYFVLLPSYFWYRWCAPRQRSTRARAGCCVEVATLTRHAAPARTAGSTPSNGTWPIACITRRPSAWRRCLERSV